MTVLAKEATLIARIDLALLTAFDFEDAHLDGVGIDPSHHHLDVGEDSLHGVAASPALLHPAIAVVTELHDEARVNCLGRVHVAVHLRA
eukprot:CAMPEP_0182917104 /NCGR_PEP_ID=MMETSP0105_2-20130417/1328_1 /TAXON_ID=81532 ORGANISM="Acanthoeca-like sp., Strain 10tr" /NCGR_SAMPLE_ID=MMETSP0105_2 /ASSEMBLY_ACC=CAM_ASM_000205 /LENGTH=88 /DNA_ID=CAMNT_0025054093 /DNA_START=451 /DNA_END=717 /DNA_ORIENTATION=-